MSEQGCVCFKKSLIHPKFKNYSLIAFCQYRKDIPSRKKHKTRIHSNNSYIKCWNKNYFSFTSGIEMSNLHCFSRELTGKKNHLKTWSFFKASYTQTSHWHFFLQLSSQLLVLNSSLKIKHHLLIMNNWTLPTVTIW